MSPHREYKFDGKDKINTLFDSLRSGGFNIKNMGRKGEIHAVSPTDPGENVPRGHENLGHFDYEDGNSSENSLLAKGIN